MESNASAALSLALLAALPALAGAGAAFFMARGGGRALALGMGFSAGAMLFLSFMDILPEAFRRAAGGECAPLRGRAAMLLLFFIGAFCAGIIDYFLPEHLGGGGRAPLGKKGAKGAFMAAAALAAHNFPEGFAVFAAACENIVSGLGVAGAVALHNVPEGAAVALPAYLATGSRAKAFLFALFAALAEPLGAAAGYLAFPFGAGPAAAGGALAFAAGIMVYISLGELMPSAMALGGGRLGVAGAFMAMAFMASADMFFRVS